MWWGKDTPEPVIHNLAEDIALSLYLKSLFFACLKAFFRALDLYMMVRFTVASLEQIGGPCAH